MNAVRIAICFPLLVLVFAFMWAGNLFAWLSSATACCAAKMTETLD
jgi:hypothetical protein